METLGNIIILEKAKKVFYDTVVWKRRTESLARAEEMQLFEKVRCTLEKVESIWEVNHGMAELRDLFHLLKHYIERLEESCRSRQKDAGDKDI